MRYLALYIALLGSGKLNVPWPDDLGRSEHAGCELQERKGAEPSTTWWHENVWIQFPDHEWRHLLSIRPGNERAKALNDCDLFLKEWTKRVREARK